ncbi:hypothetical protein B7463_g6717, partial [Scytalidium lignicola]
MASPSPISLKVETGAPPTSDKAGTSSPLLPLPQDKHTDGNQADQFGDHSSSYWPPGWDFNRYSKATALELLALPDEQYPKLQAGLLEVLGEDGQSHLNDYLCKLARQRAGIKPSYPDWLTYLRRFYPDQAWDFAAFKAKLNEVVRRAFHTAMPASPADVSEAQAKFEIRWIEDPAINSDPDVKEPSLKRLRVRFKEVQLSSSGGVSEDVLPSGMSKNVFLVASEESIASVMDASVAKIIRWHDPDTSGSTRAKRLGPDGIIGAPWILAVTADAERELDEEEDGHGWFKPVIKVAAENLADAFWWELDFSTVRNGDPYSKITSFTREVDLRGEAVDGSEGENIRQDMCCMASYPPSTAVVSVASLNVTLKKPEQYWPVTESFIYAMVNMDVAASTQSGTRPTERNTAWQACIVAKFLLAMQYDLLELDVWTFLPRGRGTAG